MKKSLTHLPKQKRDELKLITRIVRKAAPAAEMIILFGSYARGSFREGPQKKSDYDILIVTEDKKTARDITLWRDIETKCDNQDLSTHVRIIAHDIQQLNIKLAEGQYFFTDIKKEGIILFDSGKHKLDRKRKLKPAEQQRIAQDYYDETFGRAKDFYDHYEYGLGKKAYKLAAFNLHQAAEHSFKTVLLVFAGDCPHEHYLKFLSHSAAKFEPAMAKIFPTRTDEQRELFELLEYAYIGARYDPDYVIVKEQLIYLAKRVLKLLDLTEQICKEHIKSLV